MLNLYLALTVALAPQDSWSALSLPQLCEDSNPAAHLPALEGGGHIRLDRFTDSSRRNSRALMTAQDVSALLQRSAMGEGRSLDFFPYSPPLLVQGSAEDLAWAKSAVAGLETAGARQRLELSAWLIPQLGASLPQSDELPGVLHWSAMAGAGEEIAFGERLSEDFVANYDVNVSTDSGVAAPMIGAVSTGKTIHLSASRVSGGKGYFLRGKLDLAELVEFEEFNPDSPDLGKLRQPRVNSTTLNFSGSALLGQSLRVELENAPLEQPNWTLILRVDGQAEPEQSTNSQAGLEWRAIDVSLLSKKVAPLTLFHPGAGLAHLAALEALETRATPITASGVLSAVESTLRSKRKSSRSGETAVQICEGLLLIDARDGEEQLAKRVLDFMQSVETPRLAMGLVEIRSGNLRARFPVCAGEASRLTVGSERTLLTGYEAEIAPNTWMPSPLVEASFDGLAWQGRFDGRQLHSSLWHSQTHSIEVRDRIDAQLGALQLPKRSVRGARKAVSLDAEADELLAATANAPGVRLQLTRP